MRIAISGTHRSGKSTLVEELSGELPEYSTVEEPYYLLAEEGYEFAEMPSIEDFELQLERSIACLEENDPNVLFDRCPADLLGYLLTHSDAEAFDLKRWLPRVRKAMETLDLVIFLPLEERDRIALSSSEDPELRMLVDEKLREIFLEDPFGFDVAVLQVTGSPRERVRRVLMALLRPGSRV
jgi:predicted ATPase